MFNMKTTIFLIVLCVLLKEQKSQLILQFEPFIIINGVIYTPSGLVYYSAMPKPHDEVYDYYDSQPDAEAEEGKADAGLETDWTDQNGYPLPEDMSGQNIEPTSELLPVQNPLRLCHIEPNGFCRRSCETMIITDNYNICQPVGGVCCMSDLQANVCSVSPVGICQVACSNVEIEDRYNACAGVGACCHMAEWKDTINDDRMLNIFFG